ncbi:hypothetical protein Tsubulata_001945, partial [Turnera subulata]
FKERSSWLPFARGLQDLVVNFWGGSRFSWLLACRSGPAASPPLLTLLGNLGFGYGLTKFWV